MRFSKLILLSFFISSFVYAKSSRCGAFLVNHNGQEDLVNSTERLLAYLSYLKEQGVLNIENIKSLAEEIKAHRKIITNPTPHQITPQGVNFTQMMFQIHYENLSDHLKQNDLNYQEILRWALRTIETAEKVKVRKDEAREKTNIAHIPMIFHRVQKGSFLMGDKKIPVELTHDFEAMSTLVTQAMWAIEMKNNPSHFKKGPNGIKINIEGKEIELQPDHPVEDINWFEAAEFANRMSRKHNLPEVYDLRDGKVKVLGNNIYETQGYRLPTEAEQEYLLSDRGRSTSEYFTGVTSENIRDYAWFYIDTGTHAVKEKLALWVDGKDFYDLHGNVEEWGHDFVGTTLPGGKDPVYEVDNNSRMFRGGCWSEYPPYGTNTYRGGMPPILTKSTLGFRLVRTLK